MKLELKKLNKSALAILLFVSIYHALSLLIHKAFGVSFLFALTSVFTARLLLLEERKSKDQKKHYLNLILATWLALFVLLLKADLVSGFLGVWLSIVIICTSLLLKPVVAFRVNIGVLTVYWLLSLFYFDTSFVYIETALALSIIILLTMMMNQQFHALKTKLKIAKKTDPITGCIQSNEFKMELDKLVQLHERYATPFSIICIKYESSFTLENDLDVWLRELSQLYQSRLRKTDILCRYSTQTFMILLPSTNNKNAEILSSDLEKCASAYQFSFQENQFQEPSLLFTTETYENNTNLVDWLRQIQTSK